MITMQRISKTYETAAGAFNALSNIDLEITNGEFVAIVGKSGSGKSTLLNMIGGIDRPSSGTLSIGGADIQSLSHNDLASWRGRSIGFVFQFFQLLPTLTIAENVMLPMDFAGTLPRNVRRARAETLLERVGVADQAGKLPCALSGGQQQRVAIARALANDPPVILADEPTGNLDSETSAEIFRMIRSLRHRFRARSRSSTDAWRDRAALAESHLRYRRDAAAHDARRRCDGRGRVRREHDPDVIFDPDARAEDDVFGYPSGISDFDSGRAGHGCSGRHRAPCAWRCRCRGKAGYRRTAYQRKRPVASSDALRRPRFPRRADGSSDRRGLDRER